MGRGGNDDKVKSRAEVRYLCHRCHLVRHRCHLSHRAAIKMCIFHSHHQLSHQMTRWRHEKAFSHSLNVKKDIREGNLRLLLTLVFQYFYSNQQIGQLKSVVCNPLISLHLFPLLCLQS